MAKTLSRKDQLCRKPQIKEQLQAVFRQVEKGFASQVERSDQNCDWWDIWNCKLGSSQKYAGNATCFVPIVHNAIKARRTRFVNQIFPQTGRNVAVISHDDESPDAMVAMIEHYIRRGKLRTQVMPALMVAGDVEGQYTVCVTWTKRSRSVAERVPKPLRIHGMDMPKEMGTVATLKEDEIWDAGPEAEIVLDSDFCITPATADSIDEALEIGGTVTGIRRWDKAQLELFRDDPDCELDIKSVEELLVAMKDENIKDQEKQNLYAAGIKGRGDHAMIYRTWCKIEVDKKPRLVLAYFAGEQRILGARLCPYWCDKADYLTLALDKLPGNAKGMSQVKPCADMQYAANDALNEGLDSATYSLLPVMRYDPEKVPNVDMLIMDLMALWPAPPGSVEPIQFPQLYQHAFEIVLAAERYINQTLSVSPAQIPQSTGRAKRNQAEIALEQQIAIETTADAVTGLEGGILTPLVERFAEYDAQFRDVEATVRSYGEMGLDIEMVTVPPQQIGRRWEYIWYGVEANRTVQQVQQQIAAANVLRGLAQDPSVQQSGKRLNMVPIISMVVESAFSPRVSHKIFQDVTKQLSVPAELENEMLSLGHEAVVSPLDNDPEHLKVHMQLMPSLVPGSPQSAQTAAHIQHHQAAMKMKAMAQVMGQMQQNAQQPGGQPRGGGPKMPMPGGQPAMPRQGRQPAGRIAPDQLNRGGIIPMPRKM